MSLQTSSFASPRCLSASARAKSSLARELRIEKGLSQSKSTVTQALLQVFPRETLADMLEFLGQIVKRAEEPSDQDLQEFERKFIGDLRRAKPSEIVGVYKLLQLDTELEKCADRIRQLSALICGKKGPDY